MHTVFALLCFVVVIHWLIFPYPPGLLHWHCGNLTIAPVPAKQPWWIWINTSCEFIMNDCITTTKQSTRKPCAYFLGYTVRDGPAHYIRGDTDPPTKWQHPITTFSLVNIVTQANVTKPLLSDLRVCTYPQPTLSALTTKPPLATVSPFLTDVCWTGRSVL